MDHLLEVATVLALVLIEVSNTKFLEQRVAELTSRLRMLLDFVHRGMPALQRHVDRPLAVLLKHIFLRSP